MNSVSVHSPGNGMLHIIKPLGQKPGWCLVDVFSIGCSTAQALNAIHLYSFCNLQIVDCPAGPMKCHMKQYQN